MVRVIVAGILMLGLLVGGCGGGGRHGGVHLTTIGRFDPDLDNDNGNDDINWGSAANAPDVTKISELLKSYYAEAAAGDSVAGCGLLYSLLAEEVPETYGEEALLHGNTCPQVMSKFYKHYHAVLLADAAELRVLRVRVRGPRAIAILGFGTAPLRDIVLHLEHGTWRVDDILDTALG